MPPWLGEIEEENYTNHHNQISKNQKKSDERALKLITVVLTWKLHFVSLNILYSRAWFPWRRYKTSLNTPIELYWQQA